MYNSHVGYGQDALQAVWSRIIFPDGSSLRLGAFEGDDSQALRDTVTKWIAIGLAFFLARC